MPVVADISSKDSMLLCPAIQRAEYIEHAKRTAIPPDLGNSTVQVCGTTLEMDMVHCKVNRRRGERAKESSALMTRKRTELF